MPNGLIWLLWLLFVFVAVPIVSHRFQMKYIFFFLQLVWWHSILNDMKTGNFVCNTDYWFINQRPSLLQQLAMESLYLRTRFMYCSKSALMYVKAVLVMALCSCFIHYNLSRNSSTSISASTLNAPSPFVYFNLNLKFIFVYDQLNCTKSLYNCKPTIHLISSCAVVQH